LEEEAGSIDIEGGWRRKNLHSLLKTREPQEEPDGDDAVDEGQDGDEGELFACYDSDGDDGFIAPDARGGQRRRLEADTSETLKWLIHGTFWINLSCPGGVILHRP